MHRKPTKEAERQIALQKDLRENALYYAAAAERLAAFTVKLVESGAYVFGDVHPSSRISKAAKESLHEMFALLTEAQSVLAPFRDHVDMDGIDAFMEGYREGTDDHDNRDGEPEPEPPITPVPEVFAEALG